MQKSKVFPIAILRKKMRPHKAVLKNPAKICRVSLDFIENQNNSLHFSNAEAMTASMS